MSVRAVAAGQWRSLVWCSVDVARWEIIRARGIQSAVALYFNIGIAARSVFYPNNQWCRGSVPVPWSDVDGERFQVSRLCEVVCLDARWSDVERVVVAGDVVPSWIPSGIPVLRAVVPRINS